MKIYKTQEEVNTDVKGSELRVIGNVVFERPVSIEASIVVEARNIEAGNIEAGNIEAWDIEAWNIRAGNIKAGDIKARNIEAGDIKARNIEAGNIEARNIEAWDVSFFAVAFAYTTFTCKSLKGRRENSKYFCLDSEVKIR